MLGLPGMLADITIMSDMESILSDNARHGTSASLLLHHAAGAGFSQSVLGRSHGVAVSVV